MSGLARTLSILLLGATLLSAQTPALRVVVIEGEDAVNIIQQKTAVRPVVEVRDRNNLPVPGALVTFSVGGQAASFGGASTLTVATNAAGQAAVTSLTPSAAGAFQIQVSAAFQGQVATATIAQTNVMTAAQAAAAGAASGGGAGSSAGTASGAAAGGGGGLSATTIGIVGAAVAGGAVAATQVAGGGGGEPEQQHFTGSFSGTTTETIVNRNTGQTCVTTHAINDTARMDLDPNEPNRVEGNLNVTGTSTVTATSAGCGGLGQTLPFGGGTSVSGSQASLRGSMSSSSTNAGPNGETITSSVTFSFDGAVNGNTISGTIKFDNKGTVTSATNGTSDSSQTGTFSVTLTKSS